MKNKQKIIFIGVIVLSLAILFLFLRGNEDSWIKDGRGVWVKHGNPSQTPDYVEKQQEILRQAFSLYEDKKYELINLSSQCLGNVENYAVDLVHNPRISEDDLIENQCEDYNAGKVNHFIELDETGMVVRIN
jgi:hypothetical protein